MRHSEGPLILIVDDQRDDRFFLERMLRKVGVRNPIQSLEDGHAAIRYFSGDGNYGDRTRHPLPEILFLDIHMPLVGGRDVLEWLRALKFLRNRFTFVYTDILHVAEVKEFYRLGADSFLTKPLKEVEVRNLIAHFRAPWIMEQPASKAA